MPFPIVFLASTVSWFNAERGVTDRAAARRYKRTWNDFAQQANPRKLDSRVYSIAGVTPAMLRYYAARADPPAELGARPADLLPPGEV